MVYVPTTYHILPSSCHFYASSSYICGYDTIKEKTVDETPPDFQPCFGIAALVGLARRGRTAALRGVRAADAHQCRVRRLAAQLVQDARLGDAYIHALERIHDILAFQLFKWPFLNLFKDVFNESEFVGGFFGRNSVNPGR